MVLKNCQWRKVEFTDDIINSDTRANKNTWIIMLNGLKAARTGDWFVAMLRNFITTPKFSVQVSGSSKKLPPLMWQALEVDHSSRYFAQVKNVWNCVSILSYVLMVSYLTRERWRLLIIFMRWRGGFHDPMEKKPFLSINVTHFESRITHLLYTAINTAEHG